MSRRAVVVTDAYTCIMDTTSLLKILAAAIGASLGVIGVVAQTKTPDGKLTRWARWVLAGLLVSGEIAIFVDARERLAGEERARREEHAQSVQLRAIEQTLGEVARTTNAMPENIRATADVSVPATIFQSVAG